MNILKKYSLVITFFVGLMIGIGLITINKVFLTKSYIYAENNTESTSISSEDDNYFKYYTILSEAYKIIKREFYDSEKTTAKRLIYGAVKGMLESLGDPYTTFMEPEISKGFGEEMSGSFGGIGITIDIRDGWITVISPIEDTPAWRAGIKSGDKIIEIEGVSTKDMPLEEAVKRLRGQPGTKVTIKIKREEIKSPFTLTIVREKIKLQTVKSDIIETNNTKIGYIKVIEFSLPTPEDFKKHISRLLDNGVNSLIIDLRNNPGGLLSSVITMVDYFQNDGLIVYTRGRTEENNSEFFATKDTTIVPEKLPVVVLVNRGSASASEIFTGAMKDTGRGIIVGEKTFGKGSVQKTYVFPADGSLIKYTVAKYYTPEGKCIDNEGIEPDIKEEMWLEKISDTEKDALITLQHTNIIDEFLKNDGKKTQPDLDRLIDYLSTNGFKISKKTLSYILWIKNIEKTTPPVYTLEFDNQLAKAIEVIIDYSKYKKKNRVFLKAR